MWIRRGALLCTVALSGSPPAQATVSLRIEGALRVGADTVAQCQAVLAAATPAGGEDRACALLGCLRLGQLDAARDRLDAAPADGDRAAACWAVIAHHWYLRASRDTATIRAHLPRLRATLLRASEGPASAATFAAAALLPHAWFCLGELAGACGEPDQGAANTRRAVDLWLELERQVWQPGRGHFRPHPTHGEIVLPEPPDATVLAPAAAGLLIATGDRLPRHLRTACTMLLGRAPTDLPAATWLLAAAAQLGDNGLLDAAWRALPAVGTGGARMTPGDAGRRLDATLFAVTGLRLATGAGVDPRCIRLRPWMPRGVGHAILRNLVADGAHFDLELTERRDEWQPGELAEGQLPARLRPLRLRVQLTLRAVADASPRSFVLAGDGMQYVTVLHPGEHIARSLPLDRP